MAPPRRYETPLEQLSRLMLEARERGIGFDQAWEEIIRPGKALVMTNSKVAPATALRWPTDRTDRLAWHEAIVETKDEWRRAYELMRPTRAETALSHLGETFSRLDEAALRSLVVRGIERGPALVVSAA